MLITVIRCLRTSVSLLSAVANSHQWLCTVDTMPVQARILLLVQVNCPNVETICLTIKTNAQEVIWVSTETYTNTGAKVPFPWYQSDIDHHPNITNHCITTVCAPKPSDLQNLAKIKTWSSYTHTPQNQSCIRDSHMQDRPKLWWRLRPDHLVSYSTLQDPIILSLTQPYKTRSSCILINLTRPDHLVSYSTLQDPIILSLNQPYKTRSSCLLLNLTRPDHLVSYSTIQDPIILYLTQPYKTQSSCVLLISTCNYVDSKHVGTEYLNDSIDD